ncbi:MAG: DUF1028 domain-containing protein [Flavobacteriaceae bacterium]|nr:DUF1028 domain-containing protein [Flavobacteriaceae bacterium]
MKKAVFLLSIFFIQSVFSQVYKKSEPLAHTYSIVARDSVTGEMGVAVQSHWFSVGSIVIYGKAGVGVVATQSFVNPMYGPRGLALMEQGLSPQQALTALLQNDKGEAVRQVAMLNNKGETAAHTGSQCIEAAGHRQGKNFSVQANLMLKNTVWDAMANAFETTKGTLAERILASMKAAQAEGGDMRGKQSAAILIVKAKSTGNSWQDNIIDLRIEDHKNPIEELERLMTVHKAYDYMNQGDIAMEEGDSEEAEHLYSKAQNLFPDNLEMKFWYAVNLLNNKELGKAIPILKSIFKKDRNWQLLIPRLVKSKLLTLNNEDIMHVMAL